MAMEAEYSSLTMNKINVDLRLRDEEEKGLTTGDMDEVNQIQWNVDLKYCLVGRFLSDKSYKLLDYEEHHGLTLETR
ncbi:hypothetical protein AB3S75_012386 [Citrus x aurantiifolia]